MQKKLIALALASLAGSAFAQSNVTIYGVVDATFDNVRATGANNGDADFKARNRVTSNSSYIGFKGVEDLGNGLKAVFQIENGIKSDNGSAGSWNDRDTYVGLAGNFGTVVAGNVTGPTRALGSKMDINAGATGIGANTALIGKIGGGAGSGAAGSGAFDQRITNAIAYITPNFSGFSGVVGYSTGLVNTYNGAALSGKENAAAGDKAKGNTAWTLGANYENGPIYVGYAFTEVNTTNDGVDAADGLLGVFKKLSNNRLGGIYKFNGGHQIGLMWDQTKGKFTAAQGGDTVKQNVYYLSGKYFVTANGAIIAQYGHANNVSGTDNTEKTGANHYVLGYEHNLSKRTVLKAVYSSIKNKDNANYDYLTAVSASNASTATTGGMSDGTNVSGFSVGVRHSF